MTDDAAAYQELIAPAETQMMRVIWRVVRHDQLAEDTLQDALALIWRKRSRISRHPNPRALILKICLNCACDSLRRLKRQRRAQEARRADSPGASPDDAPQGLVQQQVRARVLEAIGRLPRNQALAVMLRIVQEQPYEAVAAALGCSETTARIHVSRGRKRLRRWLAALRDATAGEIHHG